MKDLAKDLLKYCMLNVFLPKYPGIIFLKLQVKKNKNPNLFIKFNFLIINCNFIK
jgi:hypothetical protein